MRRAVQNTRRKHGGFTLIEILVAVLLLSGSLVAMTTLWSLSRRITERSRDTAEYHTIARREVERDKNLGFNALFVDAGNPVDGTNPRITYYDQNGNDRDASGNSLTLTSTGVYYRARSTYSRVATSGETDNKKKLGVQQVDIDLVTGGSIGTTSVYQTTMFYTAAGI